MGRRCRRGRAMQDDGAGPALAEFSPADIDLVAGPAEGDGWRGIAVPDGEGLRFSPDGVLFASDGLPATDGNVYWLECEIDAIRAGRNGHAAAVKAIRVDLVDLTPADDSLPEWALWYASVMAWHVHPLKPDAKDPITANGVDDATTDTAQIRQWWQRKPPANIGVSAGASGLVILDADCYKPEWNEDSAALLRRLPDTVTAETGGGGLQFYFEMPPGVDLGNSRGDLPPAWDVRGVGGYVVVPPSVHPSGRRYGWAMNGAPWEVEIAALPAEVLTLLQSAQHGARPDVDFSGATGARPDLGRWRLSRAVRTLIEHGAGPSADRSEVDQSVITALVKAGASDGEIFDVFSHYVIGTGGKFAEKGKHGQGYLSTSIASARGYLARNASGNGAGVIPPTWEELPAGVDLPAGGEAVLTSWRDTQRTIGPIEWDCPKWLARSVLILLASAPGIGKSALALRIAGSYLLGLDWPDGSPFEGDTGAVLWCESESAQAINLERAERWGLPVDRIYNPAGALEDFRLDKTEHQDAIWVLAHRRDVRLIIIDSLRGAVAGDENASQVSTSVFWLAELARNSRKPIVLLHHLRKRGMFDGDEVTLDQIRGSTAIVQPARIIWALDTPDPSDLEHKRLSVIKSNLSRFPEPVGMRIGERGVSFDEAPQKQREYTQLDQAKEFLVDLLAREPLPASTIEYEYQAAGLSRSTVNRAKRELGVLSMKVDGAWLWSLPGPQERGK